jgi:hypothetical protein
MPLANPGRLFNEAGYLPESVRLKLDRGCIDSAVRTGRNLPNDALLSSRRRAFAGVA